MKNLWEKIKAWFTEWNTCLDKLAKFIIAWILCFDLVGGCAIPIAYGHECGWFAIPNLIIDAFVIYRFVKYIKDEGTR